MAARGLSAKQLKFIEYYSGNGTQAAREAGYSGSDNVLGKTAYDLLRNPKITRAIMAREAPKANHIIATREDRQQFWTSIMLDENRPVFVRLKASELLGKSEGDFLVKLELSGKVSLEELVVGSEEK